MTEFLTLAEASAKLKLAPKTIQNKMDKGILVRGLHWFKRDGEIGVRFDPEALEKWVRDGDGKQKPKGIPMARGYVLTT